MDIFVGLVGEFINIAVDLAETIGKTVIHFLWMLTKLVLTLAAAIPVLHVHEHKLAREGYWLTVTAPDKVTDDANLLFWKNMRQLLTPWWKCILHGQPYLIWELRISRGRPELCVWAPDMVSRQTLKNAIEAAWVGAKVGTGSDYEQIGSVEVARLKPIETHLHSIHLADPNEYLRGLIGAATNLSNDESVVVSVLARPAHRPIHRKRVTDPHRAWAKSDKSALVPIPAYTTNVRLSVASTDKMSAKERIHGVCLAYGVFEGANRLRRYRSTKAARVFHRHYQISTDELAALAPMPTAAVLRTGRTWEVIAPDTIPREGKIIGLSGGRPAALSVLDSTMHTHVTGATGTGKTTIITNLALQDIEAGRSTVVIDWAKGDLIDWILERYPEGREDKLCLIDPLHPTHAVGLDVLARSIADLSVEQAIAFLSKLWTQLGDQQEALLRSSIQLLSYLPGATLMEIPTLLTAHAWRQRVLDDLQIPDAPSIREELRSYFEQYDALTPKQKISAAGPLTNKLRSFLLKSSIRFVLGQSFPRGDPFATLENGGVILARVPKGSIGPKQASLISGILTAKTFEQVMSRTHIPEKDRFPVSYYGDEIQNYFRGSQFHSVEEMLTEARGWGLSVLLAHHYYEQLPPTVGPAVESCCRNKVTFNISPDDARHAARTFSPMTAEDIGAIPKFHAVVRPVNGAPFSIETIPLKPGSVKRREEVTAVSMAKWGRAKVEIEEEIIGRKQNPARILKIGGRG